MNNSDILNEEVKSILNNRIFWQNVKNLIKVLEPIKKAIVYLESKSVTLVDYFLELIKLKLEIDDLSEEMNQLFQSNALSIFNNR